MVCLYRQPVRRRACDANGQQMNTDETFTGEVLQATVKLARLQGCRIAKVKDVQSKESSKCERVTPLHILVDQLATDGSNG
jgi:acyl CoA:acetate/3-ketoacid CoA transferase